MNTLGVLLILGSTIVVNGLEPRIQGGKIANVGRYPYQASIWYNNSFKCGGSIITERFILTAAHCIYERSANAMTVVVGTNYLKHNGDIYNVDKLIWHNGYYHELVNDIGLIRVNKKIVLSETVQPIRLAPVFDIPSGEVAVVTGWGRLSDEGPIPSTLHELYTIVVSQESCQKIFPEVDDTKICALTENTSACYGDSGGPLVVDGVQVGIVSYSFDCTSSAPDVYTRVHSYISWINLHTTTSSSANTQYDTSRNRLLLFAMTTLVAYLRSTL